MLAPPLPDDESERLERLRQLGLLDTPADERFDRIVRLASRALGVPVALVTLVDQHRQWFKARVGVEVAETPREISFCGHAILGEGTMVVPDAAADPRFADNPMVAGGPRVRFYAACPLLAGPLRSAVGTLCVADTAPRAFSAEDRATLADMARLVEREIAFAGMEGAWHASPTALVVLDGAGRTMMANKGAERLTGRTPAELERGPFDATIHPLDRSIFVGMLRQTLDTRTAPTRRELRFVHPSGDVMLGGVMLAPIASSPSRCVFVARNISLERAPETFSHVVASVQREIRQPLAEARVHLASLDRGLPGAHRSTVLEALAALDRADALLEARMGDVSARLRAETAFRESERRFRTVVEHVIDPIFVVGEDARLLDASPSALSVLGYTFEELVGQPMSMIQSGFGRASCERALSRPASLRAGALDLASEATHVRKDGSTLPVELRLVPIEWEGPPRLLAVARDLTERKRREAAIRLDLEDARDFQRRTLGPVPDVPGLALEAHYRPVDAVGGDLYDIEPHEGGGVRVLVADATGHGVRAALVTMCIKGEYAIAKRRGDTPASVLRALNDRTVHLHGAGMHFTAICVDVDVRRGSLRYASAAHPAPYLLSGGGARRLDTGGAYIGFVAGVDYPEWEVPFAPGDAVYVFTDGLTEQPNGHGEMFGERRVVEALLHARSAGIPAGAHLLSQLSSFAPPPVPQYDDMTLVGVERRAGAPPVFHPAPDMRVRSSHA
jgi:PAS domain S-box-containing protein